MEHVFAESLVKNARSQHILEKLGFRYLGEEDGFKQYRLEKKDWEAASGTVQNEIAE